MNKMNKKGFTLIEMLVVIAIIAVLVSIIIPTVSAATDKAAAATNAANLRSAKAEIVTAYLTNDEDIVVVSGSTVTYTGSNPTSKECGNLKDGAAVEATFDEESETFTVYFGDPANTIDAFAKVASGDEKASTIKAAPVIGG